MGCGPRPLRWEVGVVDRRAVTAARDVGELTGGWATWTRPTRGPTAPRPGRWDRPRPGRRCRPPRAARSATAPPPRPGPRRRRPRPAELDHRVGDGAGRATPPARIP